MDCIACSSKSTHEVHDGSKWKPVCKTHARRYADNHYTIRNIDTKVIVAQTGGV